MKNELIKLNNKLKEFKKLIIDNNLNDKNNLKLHDISYYCYENNIDDALFNEFCIIELNEFDDFLKENNCKRDYIGGTSSFYIKSDYIDLQYIRYNENNFIECLSDYISSFEEDYNYKMLDILENIIDKKLSFGDIRGFIEYNEQFTMSYNEQIQYFIIEVDTMIDNAKEIKVVADYIKGFKENQVKNFKEFIGEVI